ncbi:hypothetical protein SMI01S_16490 [Sphingobacterium mizutaii NBRC 14946 = DSM 11724]|uniref:Uncharacterized protein n=1 Tax=Sphingobacterium mizutaii NBRC 14946 = DSM 11724 TaxID=1220576 RepID=A0ABQ0W264_9SPHI|nr:hypothetical protein SMI01S_16490 [Sphingobacterium mizutaii NBRC 14946 = DSM 11724]
MILNEKGLYANVNGDRQKLYYEAGTFFALMTCKGKFNDRNNSSNSPLSWEISSEDKKMCDIDQLLSLRMFKKS